MNPESQYMDELLNNYTYCYKLLKNQKKRLSKISNVNN